MKKVASILDYPMPGLDVGVWDESGKLKPEHKEVIVKQLMTWIRSEGLQDYEDWLKRIKIVGSLTTYQYMSESDIDVHIEVDLPKFIERNNPKWSPEEAHEYLNELRKKINEQKVPLPGTEHLVEYFFETPFVNPEGSPRSGIYDLQEGWLVPPVTIDKDFDIEELKPLMVDFANTVAEELDISFGNIKRTINRVEDLQEAINHWPTEEQGVFRKKLTDKLQKLDEEIKNLVKQKEDIVEERRIYDPMGQQEITFKYLQRFGYLWIITQLNEMLKDDQKITIDEVPKVKEIVETAQQEEPKEYPGKNKLMIDFDNTISNNHKVEWPEIGEPMEGVKEALEQLKKDGWEIVVYSCRANEDGGLDQIKDFLDKHIIPYDEIVLGKPHAEFYIDDKNIVFTNWNDVLEQVKNHEVRDKIVCEKDQTEMNWMGETETWVCPKCQNKKVLKKANSIYDYSSVQIDLPKSVAKKMYDWGIKNIPEKELYEGVGKEAKQFGREDNCHVTVLYGLHTNDVEDIKKVLNKENILVKFGKTNFFDVEEKPYDVVYIEIDSKDLQELNKQLRDNLEYTTDFPDYHPHMTIAYVQKGNGEKYKGQKIFDKDEKVVLDTIVFSPKKGDKVDFKLTKEADFTPSIATPAPDKNMGETNVEIPIDPDAIADEETYYNPIVDKPRSMWRDKFLNLFRKKKKKASPPPVEVYHKEHVKPLGATELMEFRNVAPQDVQNEVEQLIEENKFKEAWVIIEKYLGRSHLKMGRQPKPKTTWDDPRQDLEPFKPLPTTFEWGTNPENLNWRFPWKYMGRPKGKWYSDEDEAIDFIIDKSASKEFGVFIDPSGKIINVRPDTHVKWLIKNFNKIKKQYGYDDVQTMEDLWVTMMQNNWVRLGHSLGFDYSIDVKDLNNIPSTIDPYLTSIYSPGDRIGISDEKDKYVVLTDPFPSLQKAVRREMLVTSSFLKKSSVFKPDPNSGPTQMRWRLRDPKEFDRMWTKHEYKDLKAPGLSFIVGTTKDKDGFGVQAIRFDKDEWTESKAKTWWETHKNKFKKTWTESDWTKWKKTHKKEAQTYTNKEMEEFYTEQHEMSNSSGGGNVYHDWMHDSRDYPKVPETPKVRLDVMMNPVYRKFPFMDTPPYEVTWVFSLPQGEYHGDN